jgi:HD superfamily phosphodiesterase
MQKEIIYPVFQKRRGHPALISRSILAEALATGPDARLSTLLAAHEEQACNLFVPDQGIHMDMDTPEELARIRGFAMHREIPSPEECEAILAAYQPDERVARHSRVVAQVAHSLAAALAERGVSTEPLLVRAAGLLHDVAKGKPQHAEAGAQLLRDLEFATVAEVVEVHTDYSYMAPKLDEAAIVYLADKLVSGDRVVGLEQRFQRSFERFQANPAALASALRRRTTAEAIVHEIESRLGVDLQQAIGDLPASGDQEQASEPDQGVTTEKLRGSDGTRISRQ